MPRITAELIADSPQFTNPVKDWELDLRVEGSKEGVGHSSRCVSDAAVLTFLDSSVPLGNKIAVIENLGATLDQFDTIDLSDNEIRKVDGFPLLLRLKSLLVSNNRVCRIAEGLEQSIPQLETLVLTNNNIEELNDLDALMSVQTLTYLSLLRNPVVHKPGYRSYVIHKLPQLRVLDFKRIRLKERQKAEEMFGGKKVADHSKAKKAKTFIPPAAPVQRPPPPKPTGPSQQEIARIRDAIAGARSLDEVQMLEAMLKAGQIPSDLGAPPPPPPHWPGQTNHQVVEEDEMETV